MMYPTPIICTSLAVLLPHAIAGGVRGTVDPSSARRALIDASAAGQRTAEQREALRSCVRWSVGLEHEFMPVHRHPNTLEEYAIDTKRILRDMSRYGPIYGLTKEEHAIVVKAWDDGMSELSGRRCAGSVDLSFASMLESASWDHAELSFDGAYEHIKYMDALHFKLANSDPFTKKAMQDEGLGPIVEPMAGMSAQLGMYQRTAGAWHTCASCSGTCHLKAYSGSYHVHVSLPHTPDGWIARDDSILSNDGTCNTEILASRAPLDGSGVASASESSSEPQNDAQQDEPTRDQDVASQQQEEWIDAHMNLSNMVQWLQPLFVAVFGSADADAICDANHYTEGSFRAMDSGWGVPGTTDVRGFKVHGTTRYVTEGIDWLFPEEDRVMPPEYRDGLQKCVKADGIGADIRTKSSKKESELQPGELLPPMDVGLGVEFRFFDNFHTNDLKQAYKTLALAAEAGRTYTAPTYVTGHPSWTEAIQSVMREGWNAALPESYVVEVMSALNVPESWLEDIGNLQAANVYDKLFSYLWGAHKDGMWTKLLIEDIPEALPELRYPNRNSWEVSAINKGYTPEKVAKLLGLNTDSDLEQRVEIDDISLSNLSCEEDLDDFIYLGERYGMVKGIELSREGEVEAFVLTPRGNWESSFSSPPICRTAKEVDITETPLHHTATRLGSLDGQTTEAPLHHTAARLGSLFP